MKAQKLIFLALAATMVTGIFGTTLVVAQGEELDVPQKKYIAGELQAQGTNDVFVDIPNEFTPLTNFKSTKTPFDVSTYDGKSNSLMAIDVQPRSEYRLNARNGITKFANKTSTELVIDYKTEYYDLSDNAKNGNTLQNVALMEDEQYLFRTNMSANTIYTIVYKLVMSTSSSTMRFTITDPEGMQWSTHRYPEARISDFLVLYPKVNGTYTIMVEVLYGNVVIEAMEILSGMNVQDISKGYTEKITGTAPTLKLFRLNNTVSSIEMSRLVRTVYMNMPVGDYNNPADLLGEIELRFFNSFTGVFGSWLPYQTYQVEDDELYVAVIATPPDETNPYVVGEKERLGIPEGYDIEYSFWVENIPLDELPIGVDFALSQDQFQNYYTITLDTPTAVGFNMTYNGGQLRFQNTETKVFQTITTSTDFLNLDSADILILEAGTYIVYITDYILNSFSAARVTMAPIEDIEQGASTTKTMGFMEPVVFRLPRSTGAGDVLNITYLDHQNMSVDIKYTVYSTDGQARVLGQLGVEQYANSTDLNYVTNNRTSTTYSNDFGSFNVDFVYISFRIVSNTIWNSTMDIPTPLYTDNPYRKSTFEFERFDYFADKSAKNPDYDFRIASFTGDYSQDLNSSKDFAMTALTMNLDYGLYTFTINSENVSFDAKMWADMNIFWSIETMKTVVVDNITHYVQTFTIASSEPTDMQLSIRYILTDNVNGSVTVSMTESDPYTFSELQIGSMGIKSPSDSVNSAIEVADAPSNQGDDLTTPLLIGVGSIVSLGAVGGIIYYLIRKRKQSPF